MRSVTIIAVVLAVGMVFTGTALAAETVHLISFQGQAADNVGTPLATGNLKVRIYDAATDGTLVYDSDQDFNSAIQEGIFDVLLGSGTGNELNLDNTVKYYMEVEINGEEVVGDTVTGRQGFWPGSGDYTHGHDDDYVNVGETDSVTGGMIVDSSITSAKIVDGTIATADILDNSITSADLAGTNCSDVCVDANTTDCASCDSRFVNEADIDHLDALDGSPANAVYVDADGKVGIGTNTPNSTLSVGGAGNSGTGVSGIGTTYGFYGTGITAVYGIGTAYGGYFANYDTSGDDFGAYGATTGSGGTRHTGGRFEASGATGDNIGVFGNGTTHGGYFTNQDTTGTDYGALVVANGAGGTEHIGGYFTASGAASNTGVYGDGTTVGGYFNNSDTTGDDFGARGNAIGAGGTNHYGAMFLASGATVNNIGVWGGGTSYGGFFENYDTTGTDYGALGRAYGSGGTSHTGGRFEASGATGDNIGVSGYGTTHGGYFSNQDTTGNDYGAYGVANGAGGNNHYGGRFEASGASYNTGVYGAGGNGVASYGVYGTGTYGVYGLGTEYGGYFKNNDTTGMDYGVFAHANGAGGSTHFGGTFSAAGGAANYGVSAYGTEYGVYGDSNQYGGFFNNNDATGVDYGAYGLANGAGGTEHYGGNFSASGATYNYGVYGSGTTYGGFFENADTTGTDCGAVGAATGSGGTVHYGGEFFASGATYNVGVDGEATDVGVQGVGDIGVQGYGDTYDFNAIGPGVDYHSASSIRWKRNIGEIDCALDKVESLQGVYFDWDEEHGGNRHDIGMIAEEVGKVLPEIVVYEEDGAYATGMDYSRLTPLLVQAIKEQNKIIAQLKELVCLDHPDAEVCEQ